MKRNNSLSDHAKPAVNSNVCSVVLRPYCSNNCIFCRPQGEDSRRSKEEVSKMEQDAYAAIEEFRSQGYERIEVSGGDPLEYNGLPAYIRALRKNGFKWIRISTNGVRLADVNFLKDLLSGGVDLFRIPLYGSNAVLHDEVTRSKGSFDATVKGIRNIKKLKGKILLSSLLLKNNCLNLIQIFDLMHSLRYDDAYFAPAFISNDDYSYYIPHKLQGPFLKKLITYALQKKRKIRFRDTPCCVIQEDNDLLDNVEKPAHLGRGFEVPLYQRTQVLDLPRYRRKTKLKMCSECIRKNKCDGFLVNDIVRYGIGGLKPVKV